MEPNTLPPTSDLSPPASLPIDSVLDGMPAMESASHASSLAINVVTLLYVVAAALFIVGLKRMSKVPTAASGNRLSAAGMLLAVVVTFFEMTGGQAVSLIWIAVGMAAGGVLGVLMATRVQMTAMPQMVALLNGLGGIASLLVALADFVNHYDIYKTLDAFEGDPGMFSAIAFAGIGTPSVAPAVLFTGLAVLIGGVTFTGSLIAYGKLQGTSWAPDQPVQFTGQKPLIAALLLLSLLLSALLMVNYNAGWAVALIVVMSLALGVLLVIGIGGADMPVVIALLNSYSGIAAAMAGFVLNNYALIITGSLVGASGIILTTIMCKAMNRSLMNVLFGGMGSPGSAGPPTSGGVQGEAKSSNPADAAIVMEAASQVIIVPGYGMAVAQAQHAVKELAAELERRGKRVVYAIHPVAGRMPGHMNVLLAEAGVEYDALLDLEPSNAQFPQSDVALVIGANDVTNPAARDDQSSPLYGMPILNVDQARTVYVIKRSMNTGFAGIQNALYFTENCRMLFGDAKKVVTELVNELESI